MQWLWYPPAPSGTFGEKVTPVVNNKTGHLLSRSLTCPWPPLDMGYWVRCSSSIQPLFPLILTWYSSMQIPHTYPVYLSMVIFLKAVYLSLHLCMLACISTISILIKSSSFSSYFKTTHHPEHTDNKNWMTAYEWKVPYHSLLCQCRRRRMKYSLGLLSREIFLLICRQMEFNFFKGKMSAYVSK